MKKMKDDPATGNKKVIGEDNIPVKAGTGSADNKPGLFPEEFEEDRSMNTRMKPQPFSKPGKKSTAKKR